MNRYTIYCTEKQTKKAIELGAPIDNIQHYASINKYYVSGNCMYDNGRCYFFSTAEQMIDWLEEQDIFISINHIGAGYSSWLKTISTNENISENLGYVSTRKEAALAAIDAALNYLEQNK